MSSVSFEALVNKFEILPEQAKKEAYDFVEFLIEKRAPKKKKIDKKKLLEVSCWSDEDIKAIEEAGRAAALAHNLPTMRPDPRAYIT